MFRQSPSRNQRSKGVKIKQVLQICLLLAVCFWLVFQVKRSHDKKKEFDANDRKISVNIQSSDLTIKFGRKDLQPRLEETTKEIEKHEEEETTKEIENHEEEETEDDTVGEEEEGKHEEEGQEEDKLEDEKDEGRGAGDDEIDEHEQEKAEQEVDREEDFVDDEKEDREGGGNEKENDGQTENENSIEGHDHGRISTNTHEAREEQYNADDASSAVTHDGRTTSTESENGTSENPDENVEASTLEHEIRVGKAENGVTVETVTSSNITIEEMGSDLSNNSSSITMTTVPNDQLLLNNNSANVSEVLSLQNGTQITSYSTQPVNTTEEISGEKSDLPVTTLDQSGNSTNAVEDSLADTNSTIPVVTQNPEELRSSSNSSNLPVLVESQKILTSDESSAEEDGSGSSETEANTTEGNQHENSDASNEMEETEENEDSLETGNRIEAEHDPIDSSDNSVLDEKDVRMDLDTLPNIAIEGSNSEDAAAE